jgi:hypothetical protein
MVVVAMDGAVAAAQGSGGYGRQRWRRKMARRRRKVGEDGTAWKVEDEHERKKLNYHGYINIRSPVNPMRHRREHRCKSRVSRRTEHRLNRR